MILSVFQLLPHITHNIILKSEVRELIMHVQKLYVCSLMQDIDDIRGFSGGYVKEYIEASNPAFAIGEYWDSLAYEGGNLCYNQGNHLLHTPVLYSKFVLYDTPIKQTKPKLILITH